MSCGFCNKKCANAGSLSSHQKGSLCRPRSRVQPEESSQDEIDDDDDDDEAATEPSEEEAAIQSLRGVYARERENAKELAAASQNQRALEFQLRNATAAVANMEQQMAASEAKNAGMVQKLHDQQQRLRALESVEQELRDEQRRLWALEHDRRQTENLLEESRLEADVLRTEVSDLSGIGRALTCSMCCAMYDWKIRLPDTDDAPIVGCCEDGHGICRDCSTGLLEAYVITPTASACRCQLGVTNVETGQLAPCGKAYSDQTLGKSEPGAWGAFAAMRADRLAREDEERAAAAAARAAHAERNGADGAQSNMMFVREFTTLAAPCCEVEGGITDFDGCTSIACPHVGSCRGRFCAWCFKVLVRTDGSLLETHGHHTMNCAYNPSPGTMYANTPLLEVLLRAVWRSKQLEKLGTATVFDALDPVKTATLPVYGP